MMADSEFAHSCGRAKPGPWLHISFVPHSVVRPLGCFAVDFD